MRDCYYIYKIDGDKAIKLGKDENPINIRTKIYLWRVIKLVNIKGLTDMIRICDNIETASADDIKEVGTLLSNILEHVNNFIDRTENEWIGCEEDYVLSYEWITDSAAITLSHILYELEEYVIE